MAYTTEERIAHVYRRLGMGAYPDLVATTSSIDEAISRALDLDQPSPDLLEMEIPLSRDDATDIAMLAEPVQSWITWRNTVTEFSRRQWKPDPHGRLPLCLRHCPRPLAGG